MDNREIRKHKDLHTLREGAFSDWRKELTEADTGEHPFVDVMPTSNQKAEDAKKKMKEVKKEEK